MACELCQSEKRKILYDKGEYKIAQCRNCGFIYVSPLPSGDDLKDLEVYTEDPFGYLEASETCECGAARISEPLGMQKRLSSFQKRLEARLQEGLSYYWLPHILSEFFVRPGRILDVGCGPGSLIELMKANRWEGTGIELSPKYVRYAKSKQLDVIEGTLKEAKLGSESFDVVTMMHTLEHIPEPLLELQEAMRVLKTQGLLVVAVPNISSLMARISGASWEWIAPPLHLYYFTPRTLRRMAEKAGFRVIKTMTAYGDVNHLQTLSQRIFRKLKLPVAGLFFGTLWRTFYFVLRLFDYALSPLLNKLGLGEQVIVLARKPSSDTG